MPNRLPWLKELNNSKPTPGTEPAESVEAGEDEHVEPLFQYEAPPPLNIDDLSYGKLAKTSHLYDPALAEKVTNTGKDVLDEIGMEFKTNSTQPNATALPFAFDAADFAEAIASPNGKAIQIEQEWPVFGFNVPADLPPGIHTAKLDKPIAPIAVPADWNQPAEPVVTDPVPVAAPWLAGMSTPDVIAFDNHIRAVLAVNPAHAAILLRLKGWRSPYVGLLDTPDKAEQHIKICYGRKEDLGGWENRGQQVAKRAETMLNEELARQRQQTLKHEHREFVNAARKAWKDAIEERRTQLELADIKVAALHESFKQAKELTFEEWKVLNDRQSS